MTVLIVVGLLCFVAGGALGLILGAIGRTREANTNAKLSIALAKATQRAEKAEERLLASQEERERADAVEANADAARDAVRGPGDAVDVLRKAGRLRPTAAPGKAPPG